MTLGAEIFLAALMLAIVALYGMMKGATLLAIVVSSAFLASTSFAEAESELSSCELAIGNHDWHLAFELCGQIVRSGSSNESELDGAFSNRCIALNHLDRTHQALDNCTRALQLDPRDANALFNRGRAYLALDQNISAREDFDEVLRIDPHYAYALFAKGVVNFNLGDFIDSARNFAKYLEGVPESEYARLWLWIAQQRHAGQRVQKGISNLKKTGCG